MTLPQNAFVSIAKIPESCEIKRIQLRGREALVQGLVARLAAQDDKDISRFLALVGPSGSDKSSVVKAGLIPPQSNLADS